MSRSLTRSPAMLRRAFGAALLATVASCPSGADEKPLAPALDAGAIQVFAPDKRDAARTSLSRDLRNRLQVANDASSAAWRQIDSREAWNAHRAACLANLRKSLGRWPDVAKPVRWRVTGSIEADGYVIDRLVYETRPGLWATANLYRPAKRPASLPGILLAHSHHAPKHQQELQDMGATWARAGCYVLAPDHLGHGERAQHGFASAADFPREFRLSRQDYYFRYDSSIQLYLAGESLMGFLAWDLMRGVDVLIAQPAIDATRIVLLGGVAGGGDPCAVAAALDERIACAVPFNFGGPQPETRHPLPDDAETWFNYAGGGSWESTRNLAYSAKAGATFLPWEIVASVAPRKLVYGHEFAWDRQRDPVWKRLERVWQLGGVSEYLDFAHGRGELKGEPPAATHCGNIGGPHRERIHEAFERWFGIQAREYSRPRSTAELNVWTPDASAELRPRMLHELLASAVDESLAAARRWRAERPIDELRRSLKADVADLLGNVEPAPVSARAIDAAILSIDGANVRRERALLKVERDLELPLVVLSKPDSGDAPRPAVLAFAGTGKAGFVEHRAADLAHLLRGGCLVCLCDVRGTGETAADESREQFSSATDRAATALMVGDPLVAQQLRDARTAVAYLRSRNDVDATRIAAWGASFAPANAAETNFRVPRRIDGRPRDVEPLGGVLAMLLGLYEDEIAAVCIDRGLADYGGVLDGPFVYLPLDAVAPGLPTRADLPDIAVTLAPRPLMLRGAVDAMNRSLDATTIADRYRLAKERYQREGATSALRIGNEGEFAADWLLAQLKPRR